MIDKFTEKQKDLICRLILILFGFVLLIRSQYGFVWSDEGHYFAIAWRFALGDHPMIHEWHVSQLHSLLLVPYVKLMRMILGKGMPGFLLITRYMYVIMQTGMGLCIYQLFRKENRAAALLSGILFMVYCKSNIMTFSYYSIFTFCFIGAVLIQYRLLTEDLLSAKKRIGYCMLSGLLWGIAIICNPYTLILFFINIAGILLARRNMQTFREQLLTGICAAAPCILVLVYIVSGVPFSTLVTNLSYIMSSDGGNYTQPLWYKTAWKIISPFLLYRNSNIITGILLVICAGYRFLKKDMPDALKTGIILLNHILLLVNLFSMDPSITILTAPGLTAITIWGLCMFMISDHVSHTKLFLLYFNGIVAAVFCGLSSDTGMNAMMQGYVLSSIGTVMILPEIWPVCYKLSGKKNVPAFLYLAFSLLIAVGFLISQRITRVYRDFPLAQLDAEITEGPGAGIRTSEECVRRYSEIYDTLQNLQGYEGDLYISGLCPWGYLCTDMKVGNFTTWRITLEEQNSKGMEYYEQNTEKLPEVMIRINGKDSEYGSYDLDDIANGTIDARAASLEQEMIYEDQENLLIKNLLDSGYSIISTPVGNMYVSPDTSYDSLEELSFQ